MPGVSAKNMKNSGRVSYRNRSVNSPFTASSFAHFVGPATPEYGSNAAVCGEQAPETPGHTPGGVCYVAEDAVFCGDTIFAESIGRTDLPGGNYGTLLKSIKEKILPLNDEMMLLPGHGPSTSVEWERKRNPFLQ